MCLKQEKLALASGVFTKCWHKQHWYSLDLDFLENLIAFPFFFLEEIA